MNRYTIEDPNPGSPTTYRIYGPDGAMIGTLFGEGEAETVQLKHYIEAHDEVMAVLRKTPDVVRDCAILIWIPLVLFGCAVLWYRITQ